jgi:hypothetical protein
MNPADSNTRRLLSLSNGRTAWEGALSRREGERSLVGSPRRIQIRGWINKREGIAEPAAPAQDVRSRPVERRTRCIELQLNHGKICTTARPCGAFDEALAERSAVDAALMSIAHLVFKAE